MHVHRNAALLKNRLQLSVVFFVASLICLMGGFLVSNRLDDLSTQYAVSLSTLGIGMILWWQNKSYLNRWGPKSQKDADIAKALRGLDSRYHLFAFPSAKLPDYLLVGPTGVVVLIPRAITGTVSCKDDRWTHDEGKSLLVKSLLVMSPRPALGNPTAEAARGIADVKRLLSSRLGTELAERVPVEGAVVLMEPNVKLTVHGCTTPSLYLRSLRGHVRRGARALQNAEIEQIAAAVEAD